MQRYTKDIKKRCCKKYFNFIVINLNMATLTESLEATNCIYKVHQKLQAGSERYKNVPEPKIFAVTDITDEKLLALAKQSHILEVLSKPIDKKKFMACVYKSLTKKKEKKVSRGTEVKPPLAVAGK